jgi:hypothetical protein
MTNSIRVIIVLDSHDLPISTQSSTFVNAYFLVKDWVYEEMFFVGGSITDDVWVKDPQHHGDVTGPQMHL